MKYIVHKIHDLSNCQAVDLLRSNICASMFKNDSLRKNYLYEYKNDPANLFYILGNGRYQNGAYFIVTDHNDKYIASAGWHPYSDNTALLLSRMLVIPEYRGSYILAETVLQHMIDQSSSYENQWITFNDYNLTLYKWFERVDQGKRGALFNDWPDIYAKFKPVGQKQINHVLQYVVEYKNK